MSALCSSGIAEEAVGRQILFLELRLLVLVGRHALEPAQRRDHRQQQMQLGVLGHVRLHEQGRDPGVQARGQPVDEHVVDVLLQPRRVLVAGGQRVPVGDEEVALVLVLQFHPVAQRAVKIAQMQRPGGPHAGQHPACLRMALIESLRQNRFWKSEDHVACGKKAWIIAQPA